MGAHIEWIRNDVGILRVGRKFEVFYDPYEFGCTAVINRHWWWPWLKDRTVIFKGAVSDCAGYLIVRNRQSVRKQLPSVVRYVTWERVDADGEHKIVSIDLKRRE